MIDCFKCGVADFNSGLSTAHTVNANCDVKCVTLSKCGQ